MTSESAVWGQQSHASWRCEAMISEEPDERMVHVRICGGAGRATAGSTRMQEGYCSMGRGEGRSQGPCKRAGS